MKRPNFDMNDLCELAGVQYEITGRSALVEQEDGDDGGDVRGAIEALRDTDYRDKEDFFKMGQLLKGLAASSDDEMAKKYLSGVSDALTSVAKQVLGESHKAPRKAKKQIGEQAFGDVVGDLMGGVYDALKTETEGWASTDLVNELTKEFEGISFAFDKFDFNPADMEGTIIVNALGTIEDPDAMAEWIASKFDFDPKNVTVSTTGDPGTFVIDMLVDFDVD